MTVLMLVPRVPKTATTASVINAAATAYSESSRPVSSRRNLSIISSAPAVERIGRRAPRVACPFDHLPSAPACVRDTFSLFGLFDVGRQIADDGVDVLPKGREDADD